MEAPIESAAPAGEPEPRRRSALIPGVVVKTVRFARVVEKCGRPHVHALWVAPEKDPEFSRARKADRVMTIGHAERGRTDTGRVGYHPEAESTDQFLIFPKPLKRFDDARIVGIKFDLIEQPRVESARAETPSRTQRPPPAKSKIHSTRPRHRRIEGSVSEAEPNRAVRGRHPAAKPAAPPESRRHFAKLAPAPHARSESPLLREVRDALRELEEGKSVAAYRRLERAVKQAE